jgi:hypothetical protein
MPRGRPTRQRLQQPTHDGTIRSRAPTPAASGLYAGVSSSVVISGPIGRSRSATFTRELQPPRLRCGAADPVGAPAGVVQSRPEPATFAGRAPASISSSEPAPSCRPRRGLCPQRRRKFVRDFAAASGKVINFAVSTSLELNRVLALLRIHETPGPKDHFAIARATASARSPSESWPPTLSKTRPNNVE